MKEQMKETIIVSTHNCLQKLKGIVETQQTQINILVDNNDTLKKRIEQLEALPWVDEVFVFNDDTPYNLIKRLKPALIVKGGDYTVETVVGHDLAPVHIVPTVEGYSTTRIIEKSK